MSIIQQTSNLSLSENWRTINIDALDPESSQNFPLSTLSPPSYPQVTLDEIRQIGQQVRQLLRGGDAEGALRGVLECVPYGADEVGKEEYARTVQEVLLGIRGNDIPAVLRGIYKGENGGESLDVLMKYLYKGMASSAKTSGGTSSRNSTLTPQSTGFSQMGGRPGAANESAGAAMSVLLSWHEKVVEVAGLGCVGRCMTDARRV